MNADGTGTTKLTDNFGVMPDWQPVPSPDSDGDGLPDDWEMNGLDVDRDGTIDLDLPAMGADPQHKDIFIEIDAMTNHRLQQAAIDEVVHAFRLAPVSNPDGNDGIALHVDNGPSSIMNPHTGERWGTHSRGTTTIPHENVLGIGLGISSIAGPSSIKSKTSTSKRHVGRSFTTSSRGTSTGIRSTRVAGCRAASARVTSS